MHLLELVAETARLFIVIILRNCFAIAVDLSLVQSFLNVVVRSYFFRHYEPIPRVFSLNGSIFQQLIIKAVKFAFVAIINLICCVFDDAVDLLLIAVEFRRFSFYLFQNVLSLVNTDQIIRLCLLSACKLAISLDRTKLAFKIWSQQVGGTIKSLSVTVSFASNLLEVLGHCCIVF
jgi:hypothetical protein